MDMFLSRHADKIAGVLSCYDRVIMTGTIPGICFAEGITSHLRGRRIPIFDYAKWAEQHRDEIRKNAERVAAEAKLEIEFIGKGSFRKEKRVREILHERGDHPGLVHVLSAMETCSTYKPWHDKKTHKTYLIYAKAKCLHYNFYFVLPELGLCYLRVPTWAPFRLQFYFNGHNALAAMLDKKAIGYSLLDNAFVRCADWNAAQALADGLKPEMIHRILDRAARKSCTVVKCFRPFYSSLMQVEYATDIVFRRQTDFRPLNEEISRTAIHGVKPDQVMMFLGRKPQGGFKDDLGNRFFTRIEGTFKYYLTALGRRVTATGLKLREMAVIPLLRGMLSPAEQKTYAFCRH